jgi:hypothetical protein
MKIKLLTLIIIIAMCSCNAQENENNKDKVKYFASWSGYSIPRKPQQQIDSADLHKYKAYYRACYDNEGRLVKFEKYLKGELEWYDEYIYWEDSKKLKSRIVVNSEGERKEFRYTKNGKLIKE